VPSTNIVVEHCEFASRWGGLSIGSEMSGGVRNVFARDCEINPADFPGRYPVKYPLDIKTNKLRGGDIDGARRAVWFFGLETDPITGVHVRDSHFVDVTDPTNLITCTDDLTFDNVTVNGAPISVSPPAAG
jgi:polygalacturonase